MKNVDRMKFWKFKNPEKPGKTRLKFHPTVNEKRSAYYVRLLKWNANSITTQHSDVIGGEDKTLWEKKFQKQKSKVES